MLRLFKDKRVLLTGDTGFKGSWLALWLETLGAEVLGVALPPARPNDHYCVTNLSSIVRHLDADIRDAASIGQIFTEFRPEIVFHLAAQPLVRVSYVEPRTTFETNVCGSVNVLDAVRTCESVRALVYVSSDKCYRNREWIWGYREDDELGGHDPYSASKSAAEMAFASYSHCFFQNCAELGAASVRAGNVIGGGDWALDRIVPDCVRSLCLRQPILIRNRYSVRPWQHVLDALYGYLLVGAKLVEDPARYSGSWNFGPNDESARTVEELVRSLVATWGEGTIDFSKGRGAPHEASLLRLNCDKAHQQLCWHPLWHFDRAVREAAGWYRDWSCGKDALSLTRAQINTYMIERKRIEQPQLNYSEQAVTL